MTSHRSPRNGLALRELLTPPGMWARYEALCGEDPAVRTTRYILGNRESQLEWMHSVGVAQDAGLASFGAPIPPVELRSKVADPDVEAFLWTGFVDSVRMLSCFEQHHALHSEGPFDVLDFGCGCGRLLRFFEPVHGQWRAVGADANPKLASWCRDHLRSISIVQNTVDGPMDGPSERFDLIYCLSVFTHLSEHKALRWLKEVERLLRPGGVFVATTHGETALNTIEGSTAHRSMLDITDEQVRLVRNKLDREGFAYLPYRHDVLDLAGVGEDYGNSFTAPSYIRQHWASDSFELCDVLPGGLRGWQDLLVFRRRS